MNQPTPTGSRADVERVARRDFAPDHYDSVMSILGDYGGERWHRELYRVQLAVLKLAAGSLDVLRQEIELAKCDYRDVLVGAEYPAAMKTAPGQRLSPAEQRRIVEEDWRQYENWLNG